MSTFETLRVEIDGYVATVTLCNGKANAMSSKFFSECKEAFEQLGANTDVRVIILQADGKYFTVGLDLKDSQLASSVGSDLDPARKAHRHRLHLNELQESFTALEKCPQPIIIAVHGACVGGGIDLACCCDIRLASKQAWFTIKEVDIGLCADLGTLQRLPKTVGNASLIRELAYTARRFDAEEAKTFGFLSRVFKDKETLAAAARSLAKEIASKSPVAIHGTKVNLNYSRDHPVDNSLQFQASWSAATLQTEDMVKSFMASLQKTKATYAKL